VPGVVVAIVGFWVVHHLSRRRDREKRVIDMGQEIQKQALEAASAAISGWTKAKGPTRKLAVSDATQKFSALGNAVTRLQLTVPSISRRHTISESWRLKELSTLFQPTRVDLSAELLAFRKVALGDPFDDPVRSPRHDVAADIHIELNAFCFALDKSLADCLPR
jgi:hypothetical protein